MFANLRRLVYDTRTLLFPRKKKKASPVPVVTGLPEGIDLFDLNEISLQFFDAPVSSASHQHLSGWKSSGAYRIILKAPDGIERTLIYKVASYTMEDIPALERLPLKPGQAEYTIYRQPPGELEPFLPKVYRALEVKPHEQYCYLLEDLQLAYRRAKGEKEVITASQLLPRFHQALRQWAVRAETDGLLQYGLKTSQGISEYAQYHLERFAAQENDPSVRDLLASFNKVKQVYLDPQFFAEERRQLVHGDSNFSNIHLSNRDPNGMKLVDWEWAGFGLPEADLAALLKPANRYVEQDAMNAYQKESQYAFLTDRQEKVDYWRNYHWAQIERGLLDSAFLAAQYLGSGSPAKFHLPNAVRSAAQRTLAAVYHLTR